VSEATSSLLRQIRDDNRSGASEITERAAECLTTFVEAFEGQARRDFIAELSGIGLEVIRAQPAMAPLFNLVNGVLLKAEGIEDLQACKAAVREQAEEFIRTLKEGRETLVTFAADLVREDSTILVHSYSATLYRTLSALHDRGKAFSVICTESRPLQEGITLARRLSEEGVSVRLVVDAAAFQLLQQVDLVFVGADTISPFSVTNKIGTRGLAVAAQCQEVPFYVLAGTEKCLCMDARLEPEMEIRPASEIFDGDEPIEVLNFYFDHTPLQLVSGVITERGILGTGELHEYFKTIEIHPVLMDGQARIR